MYFFNIVKCGRVYPEEKRAIPGSPQKKKDSSILYYTLVLSLFYFPSGTIAYAASPSLRSQIRIKDEHMAPSVARDGRARVKKEGA